MLSLPHILSRRIFVSSGCIAAVTAAWPVTGYAQTNSNRDEVDAIVKKWVHGYENFSDPERMLGLLAENISFEDPTFRLRFTTREDMRKMIEAAAASFDYIKLDPGLIILDPPWAALQPTISGQVKAKSGVPRRIHVRGATFLMIENGKISRWTDYYDFRTYSEQMQEAKSIQE